MIALTFAIVIIVFFGIYLYRYYTKETSSPDSKRALDNVILWFQEYLGPNWPIVLMIVIALLVVILIMTMGCTITVPDSLWIVITLLLLTIITYMTYQWRQEYLSQTYRDLGISKTQFYVELAIIVCLLVANLVYVYKRA